MSKKNNLYLGKAGQLSAMATFLARGWNVATPEVDVGDDLFVIEDKKGIFFRVQVKTSQAIERSEGFSARFNVPIAQLLSFIDPEIYYVFVVFKENDSLCKLVIRRDVLSVIFQDNVNGSFNEGGSIVLYVSFKEGKVMCLDTDFTKFLNNFDDFGIIIH